MHARNRRATVSGGDHNEHTRTTSDRRGQVIDVVVAKTAINKSRRQRADAAKKLRKALAASRYAQADESIRFPIRAPEVAASPSQ